MNESHTTGTSPDAIELLQGHHRDVEQLWSQLQAAHTAGDDVQQHLSDRIVTLLSQHDAIETQLLYPAVRRAEGGDALADHNLDEHQRVRELLSNIDGRDPADPEAFALLRDCMQAVAHHVEEEEGRTFPKLRTTLSQEQLSNLGDQLSTAMSMAPTHPHPTTPNNPVAATVAGAVTGLLDRARDAVTGRKHDT